VLDLQSLEVDSLERETVWILDPAVDLAATDVKQWFETGEGYILKPKQEASVITYRALDSRARREASAQAYGINELVRSNIEDLDKHAMAGECTRFGLVSIKGFEKALKRRRYHGVNGLRDDVLAGLAGMVCQNEEDLGGVAGVPSQFNLQDWLGGLIAVNTFRGGE
jgi:hypothetical protein